MQNDLGIEAKQKKKLSELQQAIEMELTIKDLELKQKMEEIEHLNNELLFFRVRMYLFFIFDSNGCIF